MQLRTHALLRTLPNSSTSLRSPPRTRLRARAGARPTSSLSLPAATSRTSLDTLNPLVPTSSFASDAVQRSRRVAALSSTSALYQKPRTRRTSAVASAPNELATRASRALDIADAADASPPSSAPARVRRKPIKVPRCVLLLLNIVAIALRSYTRKRDARNANRASVPSMGPLAVLSYRRL